MLYPVTYTKAGNVFFGKDRMVKRKRKRGGGGKKPRE